MPNMGFFLTVKEAAELIGVSPSTIRNWDRTGKVKAIRHPVNNYRLYNRNELLFIFERITLNSVASDKDV